MEENQLEIVKLEIPTGFLRAVSEAGANTARLSLPECEVFEGKDFKGRSYRTTFKVLHLGELHDQVSSIIVYSGVWRFYRHKGLIEPYTPDLGPGHYPFVNYLGWLNDDCTSFEPIAW